MFPQRLYNLNVLPALQKTSVIIQINLVLLSSDSVCAGKALIYLNINCLF